MGQEPFARRAERFRRRLDEQDGEDDAAHPERAADDVQQTENEDQDVHASCPCGRLRPSRAFEEPPGVALEVEDAYPEGSLGRSATGRAIVQRNGPRCSENPAVPARIPSFDGARSIWRSPHSSNNAGPRGSRCGRWRMPPTSAWAASTTTLSPSARLSSSGLAPRCSSGAARTFISATDVSSRQIQNGSWPMAWTRWLR